MGARRGADGGRSVTGETKPPAEGAPPKARILDIGAGDPEAPANAIPNIIAHLVETETWRNAATVIMGGAADRAGVLGLQRRARFDRRDAGHEPRGAARHRRRRASTSGWASTRAEAARVAKDPVVVERAARLAADAQRQGAAPGRCTAEAEDLGRTVQSSLSTQGVVAFRIIDRAGVVLASKDPTRCGQRLRSGAFRQRLDLALDGTPQFVRPYPETELSVMGASGQRRPVAWFLAPIRGGNGPRGRRARDGRGGRPRARDDLLRRAAREHRGGVRVLGRRPACSRRRASARN